MSWVKREELESGFFASLEDSGRRFPDSSVKTFTTAGSPARSTQAYSSEGSFLAITTSVEAAKQRRFISGDRLTIVHSVCVSSGEESLERIVAIDSLFVVFFEELVFSSFNRQVRKKQDNACTMRTQAATPRNSSLELLAVEASARRPRDTTVRAKDGNGV